MNETINVVHSVQCFQFVHVVHIIHCEMQADSSAFSAQNEFLACGVTGLPYFLWGFGAPRRRHGAHSYTLIKVSKQYDAGE